MRRFNIISLLVIVASAALAAGAVEKRRDFVRVAVVPLVNVSGMKDRAGYGDAIAELMVSRVVEPGEEDCHLQTG